MANVGALIQYAQKVVRGRVDSRPIVQPDSVAVGVGDRVPRARCGVGVKFFAPDLPDSWDRSIVEPELSCAGEVATSGHAAPALQTTRDLMFGGIWTVIGRDSPSQVF